MRTIDSLLAQYGDSHRNTVNEWVHIVCVPAIVFSVLGLLWSVHAGVALAGSVAALVYYARLLQPGQNGRFLGLLLAGRVDALEAFQLAGVVLGHVVHAGGGGGVLHLHVGIGLAGLVDHLQHRVVVAGDGRVGPVSADSP